MTSRRWQISVDTGGTFTDCIARSPSGTSMFLKVLSNGTLRTTLEKVVSPDTIKVTPPSDWPLRLVKGYLLEPFNTRVAAVHGSDTLELESPVANLKAGTRLILTHNEEAPILAARLLTQTSIGEDFPPVEMRLGTTRGLNALLEKKGARTVLLVTEGFHDLLKIGTQQRPYLFTLDVPPPPLLYDKIIPVKERIGADGKVIQPLARKEINRVMQALEGDKYASVGVSFVNSYKNELHEKQIATELNASGYQHVVRSSAVPVINYLNRTSTCLVNAYLNPILANYFEDIIRSLPGLQLYVMTSSGGLLPWKSFSAHQSLLSGPAGGVVGAASVGEQCREERLLAFDMGGTSTDVSRIDRTNRVPYEYDFNRKIGDTHVNAPALAIETVASGGGSICYYENFQLRVGPHSAGSSPGPACYGQGGPLTLTDVNVLLGRIQPEEFNFPLSTEAARAELEKVIASMNTDYRGDPFEVLEGFIRIATERMSATIESLAVRKGYNPSDHTLLAFGGAGGQFACSIAESLGTKRVVIPCNAGILSAQGIELAALEHVATRMMNLPLSAAGPLLKETVNELLGEVRQKFESEGFRSEDITPRYAKLMCRFSGQETTLPIDYLVTNDIREAFRDQYQQLYGHWIANGILEIERIEVASAIMPENPNQNLKSAAGYEPVPDSAYSVWMNSTWVEVPGFRFWDLKPGASVTGPALVTGSHSTILVQKGWNFTVDAHSNLVLNKALSADTGNNYKDPVELELFQGRLTNVVENMGALLERTSFSVNVKERRDFSCALLNKDGKMVMNAPHIPVHLGSLGICVRKVCAVVNLEKGDIAITNHPAYGGSHLPDVTLVAPVFNDTGDCIAYLANRAHHAEIGGKLPGSMPTNARNLEEEGVVITPQKLMVKGTINWQAIENLFTGAKYPSRLAHENMADLQGAIASIQFGISEVISLEKDYGKNKFQSLVSKVSDHAALQLRNAIKPYLGRQFIEEELLDDGSRLKAEISFTGNEIRVNFNGTSQQHPGNFNANDAIVHSVVIYVLRLLCATDIPLNEGLMDQVEVTIPEGSLLNPVFHDEPKRCPAVVGGNTEVSQRLTDTLIKALKLSACAQGTMNNLVFGNENTSYYETIGGGGGAGNGFPGSCGLHQHMTNTRITDVEIMELRYPVRLLAYHLRNNSGGNGYWKGGEGVKREILFLEKVSLSLLTQHRMVQPFGMNGGEPGSMGEQYIIREDGQKVTLQYVESLELQPGDKLVMLTPGGGGFGKAGG
jgi:5-oxoprolinase (ATP-hydrolysing)